MFYILSQLSVLRISEVLVAKAKYQKLLSIACALVQDEIGVLILDVSTRGCVPCVYSEVRPQNVCSKNRRT